MKHLIVGNWKMNGEKSWLDRIDTIIEHAHEFSSQLVICPPMPYVNLFAEQAQSSTLLIGAQSCHEAEQGAFTGEVSAPMLANVGAHYVILGHSERRALFFETSNDVCRKTIAVMKADMMPIVCVGEAQSVREQGQAESFVLNQLQESLPKTLSSPIVIAYEPVWAIGTGLIPTFDDIADMHAAIRKQLVINYGNLGELCPILYGGSVKLGNAKAILALDHVNGALIGGASLKAEDFLAIASAA